jgi:beta-N-acetylhexosaminidase
VNTTLDLSELDHKIGRLFMAGMPGPGLDKGTRRLIRSIHPSGIVLFRRNVQDPVQLAGLCLDLHNEFLKSGGAAPLLAVDQEGGRVARLKAPFTEFQGNEAIGKSVSPEARAEEFAEVTALEMRMVGLNMDLAPVLDVRRGPVEEHLCGRTFGDDPELVARLGRIVIRGLQERGVMAVAKHFPGLGRSKEDPHKSLPEIVLEDGELDAVNLVPFRAAVEADVAGVMTSHAVYPSIDPSLPATLSRVVLKGILRGKLGYRGIILSDDLEMGAITEGWGVPGGAAAAFGAGADLLLVCENQDLVEQARKEIRGKLLSGEIAMGRLHRSARRIRNARARFPAAHPAVSLRDVESYFGGKTA